MRKTRIRSKKRVITDELVLSVHKAGYFKRVPVFTERDLDEIRDLIRSEKSATQNQGLIPGTDAVKLFQSSGLPLVVICHKTDYDRAIAR